MMTATLPMLCCLQSVNSAVQAAVVASDTPRRAISRGRPTAPQTATLSPPPTAGSRGTPANAGAAPVPRREPATVLAVATADELAAAFGGDISHIEVREHLDLRQLPVQQAGSLSAVFPLGVSLQSITVRWAACAPPILTVGTNVCLSSFNKCPVVCSDMAH